MIKISPSILGADFTNLGNEVNQVEEAGAEFLHIDIMDGHFVPNITFGPDQIKQLKDKTNLPLDVHLMIDRVDEYIPRFAPFSDIITVHAESVIHLQRSLALIKSYGIKCGVALNPSTPLTALEYVLDDIDMVLIMTVNPGFGGGKFVPVCMEKIFQARKMVGDRDIMIEIDGGVNLSNAKECAQSGADVFVVGSYAFNGNVKENIKKLRECVIS